MKNAAGQSQLIAERFVIGDLDNDLLGQGSMGEVYRATDIHTGELVAVKVLDPKIVSRAPDILERFVREGEALRQLNHPNIVHMIAAVQDEPTTPGMVAHYLVMEYVAGGSLHDLLERQSFLPPGRVIEIALDLADALTRAHRLGIIHRDIKPANVLLAEDGTPRLSDFGIAQMAGSSSLTETGLLMGTINYLSPEACEGKPLDERSDIWSFGVMLYEMLSGEAPFGGETVISKLRAILNQPVPDLVERCPETPQALVDLIEHMLEKDREQRVPSVRQVGAELEAIQKGWQVLTKEEPKALETSFTTPASHTDAVKQMKVSHNLPLPLSEIIGRDEDITEITTRLKNPACRLLTLLGVGGIGKTQLSMHAAAAGLGLFPDGVWMVELASFTEAEMLPDYIAAVFGVTAQEAKGGIGVIDILVNYLKNRTLLLVLDNCEHLIEACAWFVEAIIRGCSQVKVLATSREAFAIPAEQIYQVSALAFPTDDTQLQNPYDYPAIRLFCDRAEASLPGFEVTAENQDLLAEICRQLDGIPLAIELAAARVKVLSLHQIAERLQDRFRLLTRGPRTALPHHQTLQATMDWSYQLLNETERCLFRRLTVFPAGWTLEAAEEITSFGILTKGQILDLHMQLVEKSLMGVEIRGSSMRYRMLETVRQYGMIRLVEGGEIDQIWRRYVNFYVHLTEHADEGLRDSRQIDSLEVLDAEHDNLRAALGWSIDQSEADLAFRLIGALGWYWFMRGHWMEARRWLTKALNLSTNADMGFRTKAIIRAGGLELIRGKLAENFELVDGALAVCREVGNENGTAWCLNLLGQAYTWKHESIGEAVPLLSESLEIFKSIEDHWGEAWSLRYLGQVSEMQGGYQRGIELQKEALAGFEKIGDIWNTAHSLYLLGSSATRHNDSQLAKWGFEECLSKCELVEDRVMQAHALRGLTELALNMDDLNLAERFAKEAIEELQKIGDDNCAARVMLCLAEVALRREDYEQARQQLDQSLLLFQKLGLEDRIALVLVRYAVLAESTGFGERAARLVGAAEVLLGGRENLPPAEKAGIEQIASSTRELLGDQEYDKYFAEGTLMCLEEAVKEALESPSAV